MVAIVGWLFFLCGLLMLGLTIGVYRVLVARAFAQRGAYLTRGLLVSLCFLLLWAALVRGGGPPLAALGLGAAIVAALMTRHELHKRL